MPTHNMELPLVPSNVRNMIIETESGQFKYTFHFIRLVCSETILVDKMKGDEQRVLSYKNFEFWSSDRSTLKRSVEHSER